MTLLLLVPGVPSLAASGWAVTFDAVVGALPADWTGRAEPRPADQGSYVPPPEAQNARPQIATTPPSESEFPEPAESRYPLYGSTDLVRYIEAGMMNREENIDVSAWATSTAGWERVSDAAFEAMRQNPYIYATGFAMALEGVTMTPEGYTVTLEGLSSQGVILRPNYAHGPDDTFLRQAQTMAAVDTALAYLNLDSKTDAEKVAQIHDYVAQMGTYDYAAAALALGESSPESQEAIGILGRGTAVCGGYAEAFQVIAVAAGLDSVVVTGDAWPDGSPGGHAWNKVLIDGEWLVVDVTWDDAGDIVPVPNEYLLLHAGDLLLSTRAAGDEWMVDEMIPSFGP